MAPNIVEEIRRAKSFTSKDTEQEIIKRYGEGKLLVIDEIGRGIAAVDERYMIYQIVNERYNNRKATILITNYNAGDFINYVGYATADRLAESGHTVVFTSDSYRAKLRNATS